MKRILIIEDDITLNKTLSLNLQKNYLLESAYDIKSAFLKINRSNFDLLILDVVLPDGDGFSFCRSLKQRCNSNAAIIFLTANDVEMDIINAYNLGADDYITKPFSFAILEKKINAIINRTGKLIQERKYFDSHLQLNFDSLIAYVENKRVDFTPLEFKLLELLTNNAGHIVVRQRILDILWDKRGNYVDESSLNSIICRIRNKIDSKDHHYIKTIYGTGYMWIIGE